MSSVQDMIDAIPPVTRLWAGSAFLTSLLVRMQMLQPVSIYLSFPDILGGFEIWRLLTNFVYLGGFSFNYFIQMYILVTYSGKLEADPFRTTKGAAAGDTTDFAFAWLFCATLAIGVGYMMQIPFLGGVLLFSIIYMWSRRNADAPVRIWFFNLTGAQLPWGLLGFNFLVGGPWMSDLLGIAIGHVFYFIVEVLPQQRGGRDLINTPEWLVRLVAWAQGSTYRAPVAGNSSGGAPAGRHRWGGGNVLGAN